MPEITLYYFDCRGKGEPIRYILHQAGVPFKDVRVSKEEWPALKPKMPSGQIPVVEIDGKQYTQSTAICKYFASEYGLAGKDSYENLLIDMYVDEQVKDLYAAYRPYLMSVWNDAEDKQLLKKFLEEAYVQFTKRYEKILAKNGTGWLVGNRVTWADLNLAEITDRILVWDPTSLDKTPLVKEHMLRVNNLPNLKKYMSTRRFSLIV